MRWRLFATLAEAAGDTEVAVSVETPEGEQPTVRDALAALLEAHPALAPEVLADADEEWTDGGALALAEHVRLLHEGEDPRVSGDGLDTPVAPEDELALFPPVSGG